MNRSYHKVATWFKHVIEATGYPVHYFGYAVEAFAYLAPHFGMFHPTHAFEVCHQALFFANLVLSVQLHRYHHHAQQD